MVRGALLLEMTGRDPQRQSHRPRRHPQKTLPPPTLKTFKTSVHLPSRCRRRRCRSRLMGPALRRRSLNRQQPAGAIVRHSPTFLLSLQPIFQSNVGNGQSTMGGASSRHGASRPMRSAGIRATYSVSTSHRLTLIRPIHGFLGTTTRDCAGCCRAKR